MTQDERRQVDRVCLELLGWHELVQEARIGAWMGLSRHGKQVRYTPFPSSDPSLVVPLAEALRARGWDPYLISYIGGGWMWRAIQHVPILRAVTAEADTIQEALAIAAARAVGTET